MNIWDSVHRGLERASHEAARIARIQRLRSTIDSVTRQVHTQQDLLIKRTLEIFAAGQLTQSELLPICQELVNLRHQLEQAQSELKATQSAGAPATPAGAPQVPASPQAPGSEAATAYAPPPPDYQLYFDPTEQVTAPPPPPGVDPLTVSVRETIIMNPEAAAGASTETAPTTDHTLYCGQCHAALAVGNAYCHNCGAPVQDSPFSHLPTVRGGTLEPMYPTGQATLPEETATSTPHAEPETHPGTLPSEMADTATPEQSMGKE
jgi:hypothetical protein